MSLSRTSGRAAAADQRPELRPLQDLRHQGPDPEHQLGHARRRRRPELPEHVACSARRRDSRCLRSPRRPRRRLRSRRRSRPGPMSRRGPRRWTAIMRASARAVRGAGRSASPANRDLARKALIEAIGAGQIDAGARAGPAHPAGEAADRRAAAAGRRRVAQRQALDDALGRGCNRRATAATSTSLRRWSTAWAAAERGDSTARLRRSTRSRRQPAGAASRPSSARYPAAQVPPRPPRPSRSPGARSAAAGAREIRLRLAFADGFLAAGDRARALAMLEGMPSAALDAARARARRQARAAVAIDTAAEALSEVLTALRRRSRRGCSDARRRSAWPRSRATPIPTTARRRCCWRCCSRRRIGPTRRWRCSRRSRRTIR